MILDDLGTVVGVGTVGVTDGRFFGLERVVPEAVVAMAPEGSAVFQLAAVMSDDTIVPVGPPVPSDALDPRLNFDSAEG